MRRIVLVALVAGVLVLGGMVSTYVVGLHVGMQLAARAQIVDVRDLCAVAVDGVVRPVSCRRLGFAQFFADVVDP